MTSNPFSVIFIKNKIFLQLHFQCSKGCAQGYMEVSEVGRIAIGSSRSEFPLLLVKLMSEGQMNS